MKGILIRVGIDRSYGQWNSPVDPDTQEFAYIPIPEKLENIHSGLERSYEEFRPALQKIGLDLPHHLIGHHTHLDPDFEYLTYGDSYPRSAPLISLKKDDFIVFYAGLRSTRISDKSLVYALIGFYLVEEVVDAESIPKNRWHENAHTRRKIRNTDIVIRAQIGKSGKFKKCIPIGEYRNRAYRVKTDLIDTWGGLSVKDGYIQRSARLPEYQKPGIFLKWLENQGVEMIKANYEVNP